MLQKNPPLAESNAGIFLYTRVIKECREFNELKESNEFKEFKDAFA